MLFEVAAVVTVLGGVVPGCLWLRRKLKDWRKAEPEPDIAVYEVGDAYGRNGRGGR